MCTLGICPHIYLKDVHTGYIPSHLSQRCACWVFPYTSILKMCTAGMCPHIYLKHVHAMYIPSHLKMCFLGIFLHIRFKDVYTGHPSTYIYIYIKLCTLAISLHIYLKDVSTGLTSSTFVMKMCLLCICPHSYLKDVYTGYIALNITTPVHWT